MYTIGDLANRFGLSRSTLLYYDSIGLLRPAARTGANYRQYSDADLQRLERICFYRGMGLALSEIEDVLGAPEDVLTTVLQKRLAELNREIDLLRNQQAVLLKILEGKKERGSLAVLDKAAWVALLRASGVSGEQMRRWHREFEAMSPEAHRGFLASLGLPPDEIDEIRAWSAAKDSIRGEEVRVEKGGRKGCSS